MKPLDWIPIAFAAAVFAWASIHAWRNRGWRYYTVTESDTTTEFVDGRWCDVTRTKTRTMRRHEDGREEYLK
ncbi:hypothetical protein PQQ75_25385 [Paraburkholderia aspalathi]|uniref:hypothetical protein n=1 Tax=Paraburkholderia aspalathi TaxID=1324617 RepID=UPI0038B88517